MKSKEYELVGRYIVNGTSTEAIDRAKIIKVYVGQVRREATVEEKADMEKKERTDPFFKRDESKFIAWDLAVKYGGKGEDEMVLSTHQDEHQAKLALRNLLSALDNN